MIEEENHGDNSDSKIVGNDGNLKMRLYYDYEISDNNDVGHEYEDCHYHNDLFINTIL